MESNTGFVEFSNYFLFGYVGWINLMMPLRDRGYVNFYYFFVFLWKSTTGTINGWVANLENSTKLFQLKSFKRSCDAF